MDEIFAPIVNKKIISELTMKSMDPLEYFSRFMDLPEIILQELNGKELIKISEVSPSFYNCIASSNVLMKKIKMVLKLNRVEYLEDQDLLKNSSRLYQNLEMFMEKHQKCELFPHKWKSVKIVDAHFTNKEEAWKFFSSIQSTVECLSLENVSVSNDETVPELNFEVLTFPKLKQLKLIHDDDKSWYVKEILKNSVAVEKFEYRFEGNGSQRSDDKELTMEMLKSFNKLKYLTLYERNMNEMFENNFFEQFQFKLKSLAMISAEYLRYEKPSYNNFINFLQMQSDHLTELTVELHNYKEFIHIVTKMPKLKKLSIRRFAYQYLPKYLLYQFRINLVEKSSSITELILKGFFASGSTKLLLLVMPNVQRLSIVSIKKYTFRAIIKMKRKFEEIKIHDLRGVDKESLAKLSDKISIFPFKCHVEICDCLKSNEG